MNSDLAKPLGPIKPVVSMGEEDLVNNILKMEERLFGVTSYDLGRLAYQWAKTLGKSHSFNKDKQIAGKDWILGISLFSHLKNKSYKCDPMRLMLESFLT